MRKKRRQRVERWLVAWGEYKLANQTESGFTTASKSDLGNDAVERSGGFEWGLTDYQSMLISIDMIVSKLNPIDYDLVYREYVSVEDDRVRQWAQKWGRRESNYAVRKSRLKSFIIECA